MRNEKIIIWVLEQIIALLDKGKNKSNEYNYGNSNKGIQVVESMPINNSVTNNISYGTPELEPNCQIIEEKILGSVFNWIYKPYIMMGTIIYILILVAEIVLYPRFEITIENTWSIIFFTPLVITMMFLLFLLSYEEYRFSVLSEIRKNDWCEDTRNQFVYKKINDEIIRYRYKIYSPI